MEDLPRSLASRRGRSQEGSCCPEMAKAVDKYSRRGYKERRQEENGDISYTMEPDLPRSLASRRGRSQEGSCCPEMTPRLLTSTAGEATKNGDKRRTATRGERRQEGSCCAESCSRMPRELATVKKKDS